jgi:hypothetical protein
VYTVVYDDGDGEDLNFEEDLQAWKLPLSLHPAETSKSSQRTNKKKKGAVSCKSAQRKNKTNNNNKRHYPE